MPNNARNASEKVLEVTSNTLRFDAQAWIGKGAIEIYTRWPAKARVWGTNGASLEKGFDHRVRHRVQTGLERLCCVVAQTPCATRISWLCRGEVGG